MSNMYSPAGNPATVVDYKLVDTTGVETAGELDGDAVEAASWNDIHQSIDARLDRDEDLHPLGTGEVVGHHARSHTLLSADDHTGNLTQARSHDSPDTDASATALHHTLGTGATQAAPGNHTHSPDHYRFVPNDWTSISGTTNRVATETNQYVETQASPTEFLIYFPIATTRTISSITLRIYIVTGPVTTEITAKYYTGKDATYTLRGTSAFTYSADGWFDVTIPSISYALATGEVGYIYVYTNGTAPAAPNILRIASVEVTYA